VTSRSVEFQFGASLLFSGVGDLPVPKLCVLFVLPGFQTSPADLEIGTLLWGWGSELGFELNQTW